MGQLFEGFQVSKPISMHTLWYYLGKPLRKLHYDNFIHHSGFISSVGNAYKASILILHKKASLQSKLRRKDDIDRSCIIKKNGRLQRQKTGRRL